MTFSDKMSEQNQIKALVVDNGFCWSKAGFAGDNNPKWVCVPLYLLNLLFLNIPPHCEEPTGWPSPPSLDVPATRDFLQWVCVTLTPTWGRRLSPGVSIIFKIRVFYKGWFGGFEFFIVWPYAVFHKMQVVFYKSAHFKYLWSINSVFAKCDLQSSKILRKTLPKALRTQALTALTSNFGLIGLVQYVW